MPRSYRRHGFGAAAANAADDARRMVPMLVALKRCPRCGVRDERIAGRNARTRIIILVGLAVGTAITVGGLLTSDSWSLGVAVGAGIALLMGLVCSAQHRALAMRFPSDAETAVVLSEPPAATPRAHALSVTIPLPTTVRG